MVLEVNMVELESNIDSIYEENITTQKDTSIFNKYSSFYDNI